MNKKTLKRIWHFLWHEDSALSWIANLIIAVILVKFVIFPVLGFLLSTTHPVVAIVSSSMDHDLVDGIICGVQDSNYESSLDNFWKTCGKFYENLGITKESFQNYDFKDGFEKGDIMFLKGMKPDQIKVGDVIVFQGNRVPIIHRVVVINEKDGKRIFTTKGDHNEGIIPAIGELEIAEDKIIGKATFSIPYLGYIKILADKIKTSIVG